MIFSEIPYERIHLPEAERAFLRLIEQLGQAESGEAQLSIHKKYYKLLDDLETMATLASIRHDGNTKDPFYEKEQDYYDETVPVLDNLKLEYSRRLLASPYRTYLEKAIGPVAFKNMELDARSLNDSLVPLRQQENSLITKYMKLIASARIPFHGEVLNISLLRKYLVSPDRDVRREAYGALSHFFLGATKEIDAIYNDMVKNRTRQAKEMGYENFVELGYFRMRRNCYDKDMVKAFREQVKAHIVPLAEKLHEKRKQRLGLDKLFYFDEEAYFKDGNPSPSGSPEDILNAGRTMYSQLSPETKEFFHFMQDNQLFDVLGRKDKRAGGYMTYLPNYQSPFIFANFNGTSGDVDVITHECGHAFQGYLVRNTPVREYRDITMETAEIHSMSMEFFTSKWMELFFGDHADEYRTMQLEDSIIFIPYGCMVDEFQHLVYENPDMTPEQRKDAWKKLEAVYKPHLDYENDPFFSKGGYWQKQQHIFSSPFYYIDYCLASVCALQFKIKMDQDFQAAWKDYLTLCNLSAQDFFINMLPKAGLQNPFEPGCLESLAEDLKKIAL